MLRSTMKLFLNQLGIAETLPLHRLCMMPRWLSVTKDGFKVLLTSSLFHLGLYSLGGSELNRPRSMSMLDL